MIEKIGSEEAYVKDYTSNFDVKEFIQSVLIPKAFPNIPVNKLNLGYVGLTSEYIGEAIEDAYGTASLMVNESFITRAVLPESIYSAASLYNLGYSFAIPSSCKFGVQLSLDDVIKYATKVPNTGKYRYILDRDTRVIVGGSSYRFDYDVFIEYQIIDGKRVFNVYYDTSQPCSISNLDSKFIQHMVTANGWLMMIVRLKEFDRKITTHSITDNRMTTNSDIELRWTNQIAGMDLTYITPKGDRREMKVKHEYTGPSVDPFVWYKFINDNIIHLSFTSNSGYFVPSFNSKIEACIYTCNGSLSNFDAYTGSPGLPVQKTGERIAYNANTRMSALTITGSVGGTNKGTIEDLRREVILASNTTNTLTTDHDIQLYFDTHSKRTGTKSICFKRRDDPTGRLFSLFTALKYEDYVFSTNTLELNFNSKDCDFIIDDNGVNKEFIISPGHLWEYDDTEDEVTRTRVRMVRGVNGPARITDETIPSITSDRPFMYVNPFYIKIHRDPSISMNYNCLINNTSWPFETYVNEEILYQFQLAQFHIERSLTDKLYNKYKISVIAAPTVNSTGKDKIDYIEGIGQDYDIRNNKLRLILVTYNSIDGETGYIEMEPVEFRSSGSITFQTEIAVKDNIDDDLMIEVDQELTPTIHSLINEGTRKNEIFIDTQNTRFDIITMMKDPTMINSQTSLFQDQSFEGYTMTNRYCNEFRDLVLYEPMSMMRSPIMFSGKNNDYDIKLSLSPLLKWDTPLDETRMLQFITRFNEQYVELDPIISKMAGNNNLDFKFYNTYGRPNNYYIGPDENSETLLDSNIRLDNVYVKVKFVMCVKDRSLYNQTCESVMADIKYYFNEIAAGRDFDIHVSDLISGIIEKEPNVYYLRFIGFNEYDANKQSIFVKYKDIEQLSKEELATYVPEIIRVDNDSIEIVEEILS